MKSTTNFNTFIFSVDRNNLSTEQNEKARNVAADILNSNGVKFKLAEGVYQRTSEVSFVIHGDKSIEALVRSLTAGYNQDCYLKIDTHRQAWFINPFGGAETFMGLFRSIPKLHRTCYPGYTTCEGNTYTILPIGV